MDFRSSALADRLPGWGQEKGPQHRLTRGGGGGAGPWRALNALTTSIVPRTPSSLERGLKA